MEPLVMSLTVLPRFARIIYNFLFSREIPFYPQYYNQTAVKCQSLPAICRKR